MTTLAKIGKYYHARVKTADGQSKTISTHSTNKDEATRIVAESGLDKLQVAAKAGRLTREAIGMISAGKKLTLPKAFLRFEESLLRRRSPKTAANTMTVLRCWERDMKLSSLPPSAITEKHIDDWINDPASENKAQTRRLSLSALRTFFDFCLDHGWIVSGNPAGRQRVAVDYRILSHAQKEVEEREPFSHLEAKRMVKYFADEGMVFWQFATQIAWEIGMRLGDICNLEWSCFAEAGRVVVWTEKRDRRISVPISDELSELLTMIPVGHERYLFPEQREIHTDAAKRATLSVYFKRYCERNGITDKSFHCLRHGCITRWDKEGKSLESIGKAVGHSNTKTTKGYVH